MSELGISSIISSFLSYLIRVPTLKTLSYVPLIPYILFSLIQEELSRESVGRRVFHDKTYDYLIAGAGSAGSVLASRLTEDPDTTVLLLECGGTENIFSDIPLLDLNLQKTAMDWSYKTEPQKNACKSMKDNASLWPRGKVMGGSSAINSMLYSRANPRDYDLWANSGAHGWTFKDMFPYFIKSENNTDPELMASGYHGTDGPLTISSPTDPHLIAKLFRDSGPHIGYSVGDINGEKQSVFSLMQRTIRSGRRCSVSKSYIEPVIERKNLHVLTNSCVTRILFDERNRAIGLKFDDLVGNCIEVKARREVILSAGAINSPQLLMLSGIGPKEHLTSLGIEVISDLPVGDNLQDHYGTSVFFTVDEDIGMNLARDVSPEYILDYLYYRNNTLANSVTEATAFLKTKFTDQSDDWPDVQLYLNADEVFGRVFEPYVSRNTFTITGIVLRPQSRGYVRLRSSDPYSPPVIDPDYFGQTQDLNVLAEGMKMALQLISSPKLKMFNAQPFQTKFADCQGLQIYSDQYLRCMAQSYTITSYHPSGTCKMGATDNPTVVVDSQLRVKGVDGLRVIDASVMPSIVSGNLNGPVVAIAEKMADHIRGRPIESFLPPLSNKRRVSG